MRRCPSCNQAYSDDTQAFCLNDGARLVEDKAPYDPQKTLLSPAPRKTGGPPQPAAYHPSAYSQGAQQWPPADAQGIPQWAPPAQGWAGNYPQPSPYAPYGNAYIPPGPPVTVILSMVFGCLSAFLGLVGLIGFRALIFLGLLFAVPGLIMGVMNVTKEQARRLAMGGVASSVFGLMMFVFGLF